MPTSSRRGLDRERILRAALTIVDEEGLEALTMRRLGSALDVEGMAIYHHLPSKEAVLDGLAGLVLSEVPLPSRRVGWRRALREIAHGVRGTALAHPAAFGVVAQRPPATAAALRPIEAALAALEHAGFASELAVAGVQTLAAYVTGFALDDVSRSGAEQTDLSTLDPAAFPNLHRTAPLLAVRNRDTAFAQGLELILDGLGEPR